MRQRFVYFGILSFIVFTASFAKQHAVLSFDQAVALATSQNMQQHSLAYVPSQGAVLGVTIESDSNKVIMEGQNGVVALNTLMSDHVVSVLYTEEGAVLSSINNVRAEDGKVWTFFVNGKKSTLTPDRYVAQEHDILRWELE